MYHWYLVNPEYQGALDRAHQERTQAMSRAAYLAVVGAEWAVRRIARAATAAARTLAAGYGRWQSRRRTIKALSRLDARMLRDIGIDPADINSVADALIGRTAPIERPVAPDRPATPALRLDLDCPGIRLAA